MPLPKRRSWHDPRNFTAVPFLLILAGVCLGASGHGVDLGSASVVFAAVTPLVIAAIGQTQIVLAGGQGLAAGSTAFLVNALVITQVGQTTGSIALWSLLGILIGGAIGAGNGILVGFLRLPSTAVTLATSFIVGGVTFGLADAAAAAPPVQRLVPPEFLGIAAPIAIISLLLAGSLILDGSTIGQRIRATGQGGWNAVDRRSGAWVTVAYVIAGLGYGISGVLVAVQSGASDSTADGLSLAEIYAAVILGGSVPSLRQGSTLGAAIGAIFIGGLSYGAALLELPDYTAPVLVAVILLVGLWRAGAGVARSVVMEAPTRSVRLPPLVWFALPVTCAALLVFGQAGAFFRVDPIILGFAGLLAVAQASVVMTGHFDMSLPAMTAFAGATCIALSGGSDASLIWLVPALLAVGAVVGFGNGASSLVLKAPRVLATIATGHLIEAASLGIAIGFPGGFAPPWLMALMDRSSSQPAPASYGLTAIVAVMLALAALPPIRRWLTRGLSSQSSRLAPFLHALAGVLAAAVGIILAGYGGSSPISVVDPFTLPSLLAIEIAGFTIGRRGGNPWMLLLSVPVVAGLDTQMVALGLGYPAQVIIMGTLLLTSIVIQGLGAIDRPVPRRPTGPRV